MSASAPRAARSSVRAATSAGQREPGQPPRRYRPPGSVVASGDVRDQLADGADLHFRSMRVPSSKGIGRVHLWVLRWLPR